jgi:hypothetical protein
MMRFDNCVCLDFESQRLLEGGVPPTYLTRCSILVLIIELVMEKNGYQGGNNFYDVVKLNFEEG